MTPQSELRYPDIPVRRECEPEDYNKAILNGAVKTLGAVTLLSYAANSIGKNHRLAIATGLAGVASAVLAKYEFENASEIARESDDDCFTYLDYTSC